MTGDGGPQVDPKTLAAFIEGRLSDDDRTRVLEVLALSEADLEVLADAAAVTAELESEATGHSPGLKLPGPDARPGPGPGSKQGDSRLSWRVGLPIAAVLAALALIPVLRSGSPSPGTFDWVSAELALIAESPSQNRLPDLPWTEATRGSEPVDALDSITETARAFREGVLMARVATLPPSERSSGPDYRALQALLARSTSGATARPALEAWATGDEQPGGSWAGAARVLAAVEGQPAAFSLGIVVARTALVTALGTPTVVEDREVIPVLQALFGQLPPDTRATLDPAFLSLVSSIGSPAANRSARAEAVEHFIRAAASVTARLPGP